MRQLKNYKSSDAQKSEVPDFSKYEGLTHDELMNELLRAVASSKSDGSFSGEQIDDFVSFVSPELDEALRARLNELVGLISK